jgi:predicted phosphohydrolase
MVPPESKPCFAGFAETADCPIQDTNKSIIAFSGRVFNIMVAGTGGRMKIVALADLHYGLRPDWDRLVEDLARAVTSEGGDVLVIAGDVATADAVGFGPCLDLFSAFPGARLLVPGNHDLWTRGQDSAALYERILPALCRDHGFHMLDLEPYRAPDGTAFVGSVGWYDYSFRDESLDVPRAWYEKKCYPGRLEWMDARFVKLPFDDHAFTQRLLKRLDAHLDRTADAPRVVALHHHIPFPELVTRRPHDPAWTFGNAFMGSARFGRLLADRPNVVLSLSGHSHARRQSRIGNLLAVNLGTTYEKKEREIFQLPVPDYI